MQKRRTFNLYCDESCHLENDINRFMVIAYISSPYNQVKTHHAHIKELRQKHNFFYEIKWNGISGSMYPFYAELLDYFFSSQLNFRAIVIDKSRIDNNAYGQDYDDFYYKMYYQLIYHKLDMTSNYNIFLDIKDTLSAYRVNKLKDVLRITYSSIRSLQNIRSEESQLMQLADLLAGAITYNLNWSGAVNAKTKLIEKIKQQTDLELTCSTHKDYDKFNLFFIKL